MLNMRRREELVPGFLMNGAVDELEIMYRSAETETTVS